MMASNTAGKAQLLGGALASCHPGIPKALQSATERWGHLLTLLNPLYMDPAKPLLMPQGFIHVGTVPARPNYLVAFDRIKVVAHTSTINHAILPCHRCHFCIFTSYFDSLHNYTFPWLRGYCATPSRFAVSLPSQPQTHRRSSLRFCLSASGTAYADTKQLTCLRAIVPDSAHTQLSSATHYRRWKFSSQQLKTPQTL